MTDAERRLLHKGYGYVRRLGERHREFMDLKPIGFSDMGLVDLFCYLISGEWL